MGILHLIKHISKASFKGCFLIGEGVTDDEDKD